jgi:hypothetical protein
VDAADERGDQRHSGAAADVDHEGGQRVEGEGGAAGRDTRVRRRGGPAAEATVEPRRRPAHSGHDLLGQPGRLAGDRGPQLRARGDAAQEALHLVACEHLVREFERPPAPEGLLDHPLELPALGELADDALDDLVADD